MADTISYQYAALSALQRAADQDELCLAKYSEIEKKDAPCFFWGKLTQPYMTARCLIALSNVIQSSFNLTPAQLSILKAPIVTASNNHQHPLSARAEEQQLQYLKNCYPFLGTYLCMEYMDGQVQVVMRDNV